MAKKQRTGKQDIDFSSSFAVALCICEKPQETIDPHLTFMEMLNKKLALFDKIQKMFEQELQGFEDDRNSEAVIFICAFPLKNREDFTDRFIRPLLRKIESETNTELLSGIGIPAANQLHLEKSISSAKEAVDYYFFENNSVFEYQKCRRRYEISFEDYENYSENAFKSILMKSPEALSIIDSCLELIRRIHYGNKNAVIMRAMNFTGETAFRLHRYNLLEEDFYQMQDALQEKVLSSKTFKEVKQHIHSYYESILSEIYSKSHTSRSVMIDQVRRYIRENYMEPLTVKELAKIACVSPGYFSHMFKNETGESYKSYLTNIRMNAALELLLGSDFRLYEISEKVGYNNVRNFEEAFRKKFGSYPGDYKRKTSRSN